MATRESKHQSRSLFEAVHVPALWKLASLEHLPLLKASHQQQYSMRTKHRGSKPPRKLLSSFGVRRMTAPVVSYFDRVVPEQEVPESHCEEAVNTLKISFLCDHDTDKQNDNLESASSPGKR
ncbi:hypothetical protein G7046_g5748 [Stylonectria norvegica]|nr:hypothetical protein G7046_g5748 [Stylonectria norvegica]